MTRWIAAAVLLTGCSPVIQSASPDGVSVSYDAVVMGPESTRETAESACAQYGKDARLLGDMHSAPTSGIPDGISQRVASWECVSR